MFWTLLIHRLFGWEYVAIQFGYDHSICRVFDIRGKKSVRLYGKFIHLEETDRDFLYLTPEPSKAEAHHV